jgi:hypothetical protein
MNNKNYVRVRFNDYVVPVPKRHREGRWYNVVAPNEPINEETIPANGGVVNPNPAPLVPVTQLPVSAPSMPTVSQIVAADCMTLKSIKSQLSAVKPQIDALDFSVKSAALTQWSELTALTDKMVSEKCIDTAVTPTPTPTTATTTTPSDTITTAANTAAVVSAAITSGGYGGGGGGGGSSSDSVLSTKKEEFPWWLLLVVGAAMYFILKKKKKS